MTYKFEIVNNSLLITNTDTNTLVLDQPKEHIYYNFKPLINNNEILLYNLQKSYKDIVVFKCDLLQAVDFTTTPFNKDSFIEFSRDNLGRVASVDNGQVTIILTADSGLITADNGLITADATFYIE